MKRLIDIILSAIGLAFFSPVLLIFAALLWLQDFGNPFYISKRIGKDGKPFKMFKLRSMVVNADKTGVLSTGASDLRITRLGKIIRKFKLDEIPQLINVLKGNMSFVGPRPNVPEGVAVYTDEEKNLLSVRPGITDLASIVFSDEAEILKDSADPNGDYDKLIRPHKSRLGLLYIRARSLRLDLGLIVLTIIAIFSRRQALQVINEILLKLKADPDLCRICERKEPLAACGFRKV